MARSNKPKSKSKQNIFHNKWPFSSNAYFWWNFQWYQRSQKVTLMTFYKLFTYEQSLSLFIWLNHNLPPLYCGREWWRKDNKVVVQKVVNCDLFIYYYANYEYIKTKHQSYKSYTKMLYINKAYIEIILKTENLKTF